MGGTALSFDIQKSIQILERTPAVVRAMLSDLDPAWTLAHEGPETWSPFNIVGHLIDGEETDWMGRVRIILGDNPDKRFAPVDRFRHLEVAKGKTLAELLDKFATLRAANVAELKGLDISPAELALTGEHPAFGTVTLEQLLSTWTVHDLGHIAQIARVMAKQYKEEVGPWEAYLPVLHR
jgi:hypothetical protein